MAAYRSSSILTAATRSNSTFTAPSGIVNGDRLVILLSAGASSAPTVTPPAGFTAIPGFPVNYSQPDPYAVRVYAWEKNASSESGSYATSHGSADTEGIMYAVSSAGAASPTAVSFVDTTGIAGGGGWGSAPSITTPNNNSFVIFWGSSWNNFGTTSAPAGTSPTFTQRKNPGGAGVLYTADGTLATAGATGTKTPGSVSQNQQVTYALGQISIQDSGGGSGVTVGITGVGATSAVGSVAVNHAQPLTGNAATASVGSVTPTRSTALSGVAASGQVGSVGVTESGSAALTGVSATASVGTLAPSTARALTGNAATASVGSVTPGAGAALTGNAATASVGSVTPARSTALSGVSASGQVGSVSAGGDAVAALSGVSASGSVGTLAPAIARTVTGNSSTGAVGTVGVEHAQPITGNPATASVGSVTPSHSTTLSGVSASGQVGSVSAAAPGQVTLSGVSASGAVGSVSSAAATALSGVAATASVGSVTPGAGAALTGNAATGSVGTVTAQAESGPITGYMDAFDEDDVFSAEEVQSCIELSPNARNPYVDSLLAVAYLDKYGRFAKSEETVYTVRLFYLPEYCDGSFDLTLVEYKALPLATRTAIQNAGSAAGLIDTEGKSNA
jgi:hypothetical protein